MQCLPPQALKQQSQGTDGRVYLTMASLPDLSGAEASSSFPDSYILGNYCPAPLSEEREVLVILSQETGERLCVAPCLSHQTLRVPNPQGRRQYSDLHPSLMRKIQSLPTPRGPDACLDKARNIKYK